jgi:hypothetical protein
MSWEVYIVDVNKIKNEKKPEVLWIFIRMFFLFLAIVTTRVVDAWTLYRRSDALPLFFVFVLWTTYVVFEVIVYSQKFPIRRQKPHGDDQES